MTETKKDSSSCSTPEGSERILIDKSICNGCGLCSEVCPFGLPISDGSGKFEISKPELCTECSACQRNCPTQAIIMNEQEGCGCLWDARSRKKAEKSGKAYCGCGCAPTESAPIAPSTSCCSPTDTSTSCCGPNIPESFDKQVLKAFDEFIKPNLNTCCPVPEEERTKKEDME